jgi:ABC-type phosphate transport system substrate-binding protein
VLLLLGLFACEADPPPPPPTLPAVTARPTVRLGVTDGAPHLLPLAGDLLDFEAAGFSLTLVQANDATLLADQRSGLIDAALVHAVPGAYAAGWQNPVAWDGLALLTHPDNPVSDLTLAQAAALLSGRSETWRDAGGPDLPVLPVVREPGAGSRQLLSERVLGSQRLTLQARIAVSPAELAAVVAAEPGALGVAFLGALPDDVALNIVAVDGVLPRPETLADQSYPLTTLLLWVDSAEPTGPRRAVLSRLQSEAGQAALRARYGSVR